MKNTIRLHNEVSSETNEKPNKEVMAMKNKKRLYSEVSSETNEKPEKKVIAMKNKKRLYSEVSSETNDKPDKEVMAMKNKKKNERKKYLIDWRSQSRLAFTIISYILIYYIVFTVLIFTPLGYSLISASSPETQYERASEFLALHKYIWPAFIVTLVLISLHSVIVTNKIAGPIYRFKAIMKSILSNDLSVKVTLRKGDYFADLMDDMNKSLEHLREVKNYINEKDEDINKEINNMVKLIEKNDSSEDELKKVAAKLQGAEKDLKEYLNQINT